MNGVSSFSAWSVPSSSQARQTVGDGVLPHQRSGTAFTVTGISSRPVPCGPIMLCGQGVDHLLPL